MNFRSNPTYVLGKASFIFLFAVSCSFLYLVTVLLPDRIVDGLRSMHAYLSYSLLSVMGKFPTLHGTYLILGGVSIEVTRECSLLYPSIPLLAFITAYPSRVKDKIKGIILGLGALVLINAVRIVSIVIAGTYSHELMEYIHTCMAESMMILAVLWLCLVWLARISQSTMAAYYLSFVTRTTLINLFITMTWPLAGKRYAWAVVSLTWYALSFAGFAIGRPAESSIGINSVSAVGPILFSALVLASLSLGKRVGILGVITGFVILFIIQL
ncbi:MAG TPA: hypothetical protein VMU10_10880, partial [Desulfomonilia bacterium]|nr:hypothetical protein [Desulfomonilia bacterium]